MIINKESFGLNFAFFTIDEYSQKYSNWDSFHSLQKFKKEFSRKAPNDEEFLFLFILLFFFLNINFILIFTDQFVVDLVKNWEKSFFSGQRKNWGQYCQFWKKIWQIKSLKREKPKSFGMISKRPIQVTSSHKFFQVQLWSEIFENKTLNSHRKRRQKANVFQKIEIFSFLHQ